MRTATSTLARDLSRLSADQMVELNQVGKAREAVQHSQLVLAGDVARLHASVHDALQAGVPVRTVAEVVKVSTGTVYRMVRQVKSVRA